MIGGSGGGRPNGSVTIVHKHCPPICRVLPSIRNVSIFARPSTPFDLVGRPIIFYSILPYSVQSSVKCDGRKEELKSPRMNASWGSKQAGNSAKRRTNPNTMYEGGSKERRLIGPYPGEARSPIICRSRANTIRDACMRKKKKKKWVARSLISRHET